MAFSLSLASLLLAVVSTATAARSETTSIDQYPSFVAVENLGAFTGIWGQSCAASVLNPTWILSAATCFDGILYLPERRRVRAGTANRNLGGQIILVEKEYNHPTFGNLGNDGDITVVKLKESIEYNPVIQAAYIISQGFQLPERLPIISVGWGTSTQGEAGSQVLLRADVAVVDQEWCRQVYADHVPPSIVTSNMLCAGYSDYGNDACVGDTGGPVFYRDATETLIVVGIASWSYGCGNDTYPGVNTAVEAYTDWILATAV